MNTQARCACCALLLLAIVSAPAGPADSPQLAAHPVVAQIIGGIHPATVNSYVENLTGISPVTIGGQSFTLTTRNTYFTDQIQKATQYVFEFMQDRGLTVGYHSWSNTQGTLKSRNVIGTIAGTVLAGEIVLITAHLDNEPQRNPAPGADDNASGSAALMIAADGMSGHRFKRTVRFVFFTGEEQGFFGSHAYAAECKARNENIVAVLNMDMLGWDGNNDGMVALHTRRKSDTAGYARDMAIVATFNQVIGAYGLTSLHLTTYNDQPPDVDNKSFWDLGYPGVLAIEDDGYDLNPNYHTMADTAQNLNLNYLTAFIKASAGTAAHLAGPTSITIYLPLIQR